MPKLVAISKQQHANKRWQRYTSYSFAVNDTMAPLVSQELPRACLSVPIGFVRIQQGFRLVAIQGLLQGRNSLVAPDGRWVGGYVPAIYRSYPFTLARTEDERRVLCIREDSDLLSDSEGELFFDAEGQVSQPLQAVLTFLEKVAADEQHTLALCALLEKYELIQPWNIKLKADGEQKLEGFFRVDEVAFNALPIEALDVLRKAGALPLVYSQLLSMQNLRRLGQLLVRHTEESNVAELAQDGDLDLEFLQDDGGNIRFQ